MPLFTCIVYVARVEGGVQARVANLADITANAASEREALAEVVSQFKQRVAELTARREEIPWIDPPADATSNEQQRLIPVHL